MENVKLRSIIVRVSIEPRHPSRGEEMKGGTSVSLISLGKRTELIQQ